MEACREEAEKWIASPEAQFVLSAVNEGERELVFHGKSELNASMNFKITYAMSDNPKHMVVSSEDDETKLHLFEVNDILAANKNRTLTEILNIIQTHLCPQKMEDYDDADDSGAESNEEFEEDDFEEDDFDDYNLDCFTDDNSETVVSIPHESKIPDDEDDIKLNLKYSVSKPASLAVSRLMSDFKNLKKSAREGNIGIRGGPRGDNLFIWDVQLTDFDNQSHLGVDLARYATKYNEEPVVKLEMEFPSSYPMQPPFIRILKPKFEFLTGHVTIGGSICMELLTNSGWSPSNDIESILVQVRAAIMSDTNARLHKNPNVEYSAQEARSAFRRMTMKYGWN